MFVLPVKRPLRNVLPLSAQMPFLCFVLYRNKFLDFVLPKELFIVLPFFT
jgi:hypothetical protein